MTSSLKLFFPYILILYYIKQIDSKLPCVCSVVDNRGRQNVVRTKKVASYITLQHQRRAPVQNIIVFHFSIAARKTSFHAFGHFVVSHGIERLLQKYIFFEFTGYFPLFLRKMRDMPHSLLPFNNAPQYISYKHDMHEPIRYVLDHLDE